MHRGYMSLAGGATRIAVLLVALAVESARASRADALGTAASLLGSRQFQQAAVVLRELLAVDPANRRAHEMLAFALESTGDLDGERRVRSALAAEFPDYARLQADYGRVLERSGDMAGALRAYRLARERGAAGTAPELDAAIERMKGRTATEVAAPLVAMS